MPLVFFEEPHLIAGHIILVARPVEVVVAHEHPDAIVLLVAAVEC